MNSQVPPKVFVSHATADKDRFVNQFAAKLRANGVDAWLDDWEMLPGDSLVDKIFEEGLKEAEAVVVVLSENSVESKWVKEELNTSVVARIERGTRLIPVVIDECEVPESLKSTIWERISNLEDFEHSLARILATVFGQQLKPEIGDPPTYTSVSTQAIDGLNLIDNIVLKSSCEFLLSNPDSPIDPSDIFGPENTDAPPKSEVLDSIDILEDAGLLEVSRSFGGGPDHWGCHYRVTLLGFQTFCEAYVDRFDTILNDCAGLIVNKGVRTNFELVDQLGIDLMVANHVIRLLVNNDCVQISGRNSDRIYIWDVKAKLRRMLP